MSTPSTSPRISLVRRAPALALAVLLVGGTAFAACSSSEDATDGTTTTTTAQDTASGDNVERFNDPSGPIDVTVGQVFQIAIPADPGACFSWDFTTTDVPEVQLVTSRPSAIVNDQGSEPLTGESDTDIYEFKAVAAGGATLEFQEISPCEPGTTRATKSITVNVAD
jgi:predicted secreted protein